MRSEALPITVADLLRKQATMRSDAPALQDAQGVLSFAELERWASRIAQALLASGVQAGERIAVLAENRREYIGLQLAAAKIGAIVACLNWRLADAEAAHCLRLVSPRLVFVSQRHADVLVRIAWSDCPVIGLEAEFDGFVAPGIATSQPITSRSSVAHRRSTSSPSCTMTLPPIISVARLKSVAAMWNSGLQAT